MASIDIEDIQDVERYFVGSIIGVPYKNKWKPFCVETVNIAAGYIVGRTVKNNRLTPLPWDTFINDCYIAMPPVGAVQIRRHAFFISRAASRQWRRGFDINQLNVTVLSASAGMLEPRPFEVAAALYNRKFTPFPRANTALYEGEIIGAALSRNLSLIAEADYANNLLVYKTLRIAEVDQDCQIHFRPGYDNLIPLVWRELDRSPAKWRKYGY